MFTILKIVHTRPDVSSRQLPPYFNSGKLLTTNVQFCTRVSACDSDYSNDKTLRAHITLS